MARSFVVTRAEADQTLAAVLRGRLGLSWSKARALVESRRVLVGGRPVGDPAGRLRPGQRVEVIDAAGPLRPGRKPPPAKPAPGGPRPTIVYADDDLVVVDKPPGLTTMRHAHEAAEFGERGRRFLPATLADILPP